MSSAKLGGRYAISVMVLIAVGLSGCGGGSETGGSGSPTGSVAPCPPPFGICGGAGQGGSGGNPETDSDDPSTPTGLSVSGVTPSQLNLDWADSTDNVAVTGYRVFRNGVLIATLGNVSAYQNTGLTASTTYSYTVQAFDAAGNASVQSTAAIVTTPAVPDTAAPSTPSGLVATAVSGSRIDLSWSASTDNVGVTGYRVFQNGALLISLGNVTAYQDTALVAGETYVYTIRAFDAAGNVSGLSSAASATTPSAPDNTPPSIPTNLSANAVAPTQVNLVWSPSTDDGTVDGYRVYRNGAFLGQVSVTAFQDTTAAPSTNYSYNVDAIDIIGNISGLSAPADVTTPAAPDTVAPSTPSSLSATAVSTSRINLSWVAATDNVGVTGYRIFRNGSLLTTVGNVTTFANTGLAASTTYSYAVHARDGAGNVSAASNTASATTQTAADTTSPSTPSGLAANATSSSQINLSWNASTDNVGVTGYRVYRNGSFLIALAAVTSFSDAGLTASTPYSYNVDAVDAAGNASGISSTASATTQASGGAPGTPSISAVLGTIAHGSSIAISGSSFGAKSHAGPMLYDDFDDASTTNINGRAPQIHQGHLASYGSWRRTAIGPGSIPQIVRDNSSTKALSTWHARMAFTGDYWALYLEVDPINYFTTGQEMYLSFWYRYRRTGASHPRQTKAWIAFPPSGSDKAYWSTAFGNCESGGWRLHRTEVGDTLFGMTGPEVDNEWIRVETYLKQSAPSTSNGTWQQAVYRTNTPRRITAALNNAVLRTSSANWTFWAFGGAYYDKCNSGDNGTIDVDEFYMDSTRARVELCDAPTFSASTRCELQVPTAWTDTSITATLKRGQLSPGVAYLYIFNASGSANAAGHAVTILP